MSPARNVLTPEALAMMDTIARTGSFAGAARELGKVPSALTYNVRQLEEALDVLLFDRSSRQARLTAAGEELLTEGRRLLEQMDAVANRVKRVGTGWETQLTVAADGILSRATLFDLCESFYAIEVPPVRGSNNPNRGTGTRLRLRTEVMTGTWESLVTGQADVALGVGMEHAQDALAGIRIEPLGEIEFVYAVAPHHPLALGDVPLTDTEMLRHRAVAVADSAQRLAPLTLHLLPGQDVLTVSSMAAKVDAQLRGLGCGYLPLPVARDHVAAGRLIVRQTQRAQPLARLGYAWRTQGGALPGAEHDPQLGLALQWWLSQLRSPTTRQALVERHAGMMTPID